MKMANGTDLYDMVFATDHEAGLKIMSYLYQKAAEREPKMKEEALQAQSGQGGAVRRGPGQGAGVEERALLGPDLAALVVTTRQRRRDRACHPTCGRLTHDRSPWASGRPPTA